MSESVIEIVEPQPEAADIKICAVISVPMLGWNPTWGCIHEALRPFGIPIRLGYGAFWHQTMSNLLEDCIKDGLDWVLTLDYDSVFDSNDLTRLIRVFGQNAHIDALTAMEPKRGVDDAPLVTIRGSGEVDITDEPIKVSTAHFGMTLIRLSSLAKMPKPWFVSVPDPFGSYKTQARVDGDIFYWHQWEKCGNTVYVDPVCKVGHLQPMVAMYDRNYKVNYLHVTEWRKFKKENAF